MESCIDRKFILVLLAAVLIFGCFDVVRAAFNEKINYQGKLTNTSGVSVPNGSYNIRFRLCTASNCAGGTDPIWIETLCYSPDSGTTCDGTGTDQRVSVSNGLFSVLAGGVSSLASVNFNQTLYLEVQVGGSAATPSWETLTPRKALGAVPAAFEAKQLGGKTWAAPDAIGSGTPAGGAFTTFSSTGLTTVGNNSATVAIDSSSWDISTAGAMTGIPSIASSGALNLSAASASTWTLANVANALNVDSDTLTIDALNGRAGIGTASPSEKLHVYGTAAQTNAIIGTSQGSLDMLSLNLGGNGYVDVSANAYFKASDLTWYRRNDLNDSWTNSMTTTADNSGSWQVMHKNVGTGAIGSFEYPFTILANGNVGIGDAVPDSQFTVGTTSQFQVNSSGQIAAIAGYTQATGNFSISGTGTFGTGTGAVSLNGATSVTGTNTFTVGTGLTTLGGNLTVTGTAWTAVPTISGLITATSGLTSNGAVTVQNNSNFSLASGTGTFTQTYTGTGNAFSVASSSTTDLNKALNISQSGATVGIDYGLYAVNTGAGTTNVGGYFSASGATNNYGLIVENGNVGIGTATPTSLLQLSSVNPQVSLIDITNSSSAGIVNVSTLSINGTDPVMNFGFGAAEGASRHFNFRVGGVNLLTIRGSGYVGINDITPDGWLDVEPTGATTVASYGINLNNTATSSTASINKYGAYISSTGTWNGASANNYGLYVDTPTGGTNNYAAVFAGGNVGIGTATPDAALNVASGQISFGSVYSTTLFNVSTNFSSAGNAVGMRLVSVLTPGSGSSVYGLNLAPTAGSSTENIADAATILVTPPGKGNSGTLTNLYGLKIATSASTSTNAYGLYVDAPTGGSSVNAAAYFSDKVGIGITAPTEILHIIKNQNASTKILVENTTAGAAASANIRVSNDTGLQNQIGIYSASTTAFGAIAASDAYLYSTAAGLNLMANNASGIIKISTGGNAEKMRIDNSGNVGIGDTAPTNKKLSISASGAQTAAYYGAYLANTATSSTASINKYGAYISSTGTWNGASANNYGLYVDTPTGGTNNYAAIFAGGNVGIGVINPASLLYMQKDQNSGTYLTVRNATAGTAAYETFRLTEDDSNKALDIFHLNTSFTTNGILTANTSYIDSLDSGGLVLGSRNTAGVVKFFTGGLAATNERMRIDNAGNVGIGTTTPAYSLDIQKDGDNAIVNTTTYGATFAGSFYGASARGTQASPTASQLDDLLGVFGAKGYGATGFSAWSKAVIMMKAAENWTDSAQGTYMLFATTAAGGTTRSERMRITDAGYVGIGLTPTYQFQLSTDSAAKPSTNTWTIASDERIKKDITPFSDGLSVIEKINPIWYKYNGLAGFTADGKENIGVLAQEIKDVAPYTVSSYMTKLHSDDAQETELFNFNSHALTFIMINAIKEQKKQIEELKLAVNPSGNIIDSSGEAIIVSLGQNQSFKDLVASAVKDALTSLSGTIATAGEWTFGKITTKKLCVDDVCVDKSQLQELLNKNETESQSNIADPNDQIIDVDNTNSDASSYFENN
ncbi:MAG: tail fiber domain-containing protein [Candidatus Paceibacterota bacterium]|jgi:hypothetical protein